MASDGATGIGPCGEPRQAACGAENRYDGSAARCHDPYLRCALYGAAQATLGIRGGCVLSHSPQGCFQLVDAAFGWQNADYTETLTLCTKLCEDEIVHGGEELLARTVLEARGLDIRVMFVLTACGPEIVGDDIVAVCDDLRDRVGFRLVPVRCAGFRGDQNQGADMALEALLDELVVDGDGPTIPGSVCLIAPHASSNPTWMGDLAWVKDVLAQMGASAVTTLCHDTPLEDLARVARSEGSIVLSHDAGRHAAQQLAARHGVEAWCDDVPLPIGFTNTARWLEELGGRLGAVDVAWRLIADGERRVVEVCRRKGLDQSTMHRAPAAIVADATVGVPLLRFVTEDLEMIPELVCLRSGDEQALAMMDQELADLQLAPRVITSADVYQARMALADVRPEMVFGSNVEAHAVEPLGIPFVLQVANPIARRRLVDRAYWGYDGMLNLIEIIQNDVTDRYRSKMRRYKARW